MSDLVEWLRACIAEDETASVHEEACGWNLAEYGDDSDVGDANGGCVCRIGARWDAVCKAHRTLIDVALENANGTDMRQLAAGEVPDSRTWEAVHIIAAAYADRPGYRQEWKP